MNTNLDSIQLYFGERRQQKLKVKKNLKNIKEFTTFAFKIQSFFQTNHVSTHIFVRFFQFV